MQDSWLRNRRTIRRAAAMAYQGAATYSPARIMLDGRHPTLLDHHEHGLLVTAGYVDVFAVSLVKGDTEGARHHLFRVESGEVILDLQETVDASGVRIQVVAVGGPGAEALAVPRLEIRFDLVV